MKKNQTDRTWQCHCEAIEIFFGKFSKNCFHAANSDLGPKNLHFFQFSFWKLQFWNLNFFSITFFSAYIWSTKKIFQWTSYFKLGVSFKGLKMHLKVARFFPRTLYFGKSKSFFKTSLTLSIGDKIKYDLARALAEVRQCQDLLSQQAQYHVNRARQGRSC